MSVTGTPLLKLQSSLGIASILQCAVKFDSLEIFQILFPSSYKHQGSLLMRDPCEDLSFQAQLSGEFHHLFETYRLSLFHIEGTSLLLRE